MLILGHKWQIGEFMAAQTEFIVPTRGWVRDGLGLYRNFAGLWWLVHLETGHGVVRLGIEDANGMGHETFLDIIDVASEVAEATDWSFSGAGGWKNRDPQLPAKLQAIADAHPPGMVTTPAGNNVRRNEALARGVMLSRLDA